MLEPKRTVRRGKKKKEKAPNDYFLGNWLKNVTFPHEAIRGINFSSAQVDAFPHHEWPEATSDREMHPRVLRKC